MWLAAHRTRMFKMIIQGIKINVFNLCHRLPYLFLTEITMFVTDNVSYIGRFRVPPPEDVPLKNRKTEESQKSDWNLSLTRQEDSPWLTSVIENQPPPCRKQWCHPIIYCYWWLRVSGSRWLVLRFPHLKAGVRRPPTVTGDCHKIYRRPEFRIGRYDKIKGSNSGI